MLRHGRKDGVIWLREIRYDKKKGQTEFLNVEKLVRPLSTDGGEFTSLPSQWRLLHLQKIFELVKITNGGIGRHFDMRCDTLKLFTTCRIYSRKRAFNSEFPNDRNRSEEVKCGLQER